MDLTALFSLTYGMYIVSTEQEGKLNGCVINTFSQITAEPLKVIATINKNNFTCKLIEKSKKFAITTISEECPIDIIRNFGFKSGKDCDKFENYDYKLDEQGMPYISSNMVSRFSVKVIEIIDVGSHNIFIGEVVNGENLEKSKPMSYGYYHKVKNGVTPKNASTYVPNVSEKHGYRCEVCGYILEEDILPKDFICPVCNATHDKFTKI